MQISQDIGNKLKERKMKDKTDPCADLMEAKKEAEAKLEELLLAEKAAEEARDSKLELIGNPLDVRDCLEY